MLPTGRLFDISLRWQGLPYRERPPAKPALPGTPRGLELYDRYGLSRHSEWATRETIDETLGSLDLLDRLPRAPLEGVRRQLRFQALDVGAKNWRYAGALSAWIEAVAPGARVELTGAELDAFRMYASFRTRASYGHHFAARFSTPEIRLSYRPMDASDWEGSAKLITWLFPFVLPGPHRAWGLPERKFDPEGLFSKIESKLARGGALVMANQGEREWERARYLFSKLQLRFHEVVEGSLHASPYPIFLTLWTRDE